MKARLPLLLTTIALIFLLDACAARRPDGYRPPPAQDPWAAWEANWSGFNLVSGAYMVIERGERSRIDLSSDRGAEAIVILKPGTINLVNQRERYYLDEEDTPANADRIVGLYLPPTEVAALLSGRGIEPKSYDQLYKDPAEDGGLTISAFHAGADLRLNAYIDSYGRLRSVRFVDSLTDRPVVSASYLGFRLDKRTGLVWPGVIEVELLSHGESVRFNAYDVDHNPEGLDLKFIFATHAHRNRLRLADVPPGPPLLYRSAKEYVQH
jgi:hypothetical protein